MNNKDEILILDYTDEHAHYFGSLNKDWIQKHYTLEAKDLELLDYPRQAIIDTGGAILFASYRNLIIGTVGLSLLGENRVEMVKLAVKEEYRGLGAGKLLCLAALQKAAQMGVEKMVLYSNTLQEKAIDLYRKLGFEERPVEKGVYARANIKMEYSFRNGINKSGKQMNWFERRFEFNTGLDLFEPLTERMAGAPGLIYDKIVQSDQKSWIRKVSGKWSVKEHLGHLSILEPIWRLRFQDIKAGKPIMEVADLSNGASHEADFNSRDLEELYRLFEQERKKTLDLLALFSEQDLQKRSLHPRLKQPMNCCDLMHFIAEHDIHHFNHINSLLSYD